MNPVTNKLWVRYKPYDFILNNNFVDRELVKKVADEYIDHWSMAGLYRAGSYINIRLKVKVRVELKDEISKT